MSSKLTTGLFIGLGVILAVVNFSVFTNLDNNSISKLLDSLKGTAPFQKAALLPDIKPGKSYSSSVSRNQEIDKIKNFLPYQDPAKDFTIELNIQTKDITVYIPKAKDVTDYRTKKLAAELKLQEFGSENLCLLLVFWSAPPSVREMLAKNDTITTGCKN